MLAQGAFSTHPLLKPRHKPETEHTNQTLNDTDGPRYIFDAYRDETNKFRDTRRFAKMNNPTIPRGHALNLLTGEVEQNRKAPVMEMNPRGEVTSDPVHPTP